MAVIAGAGLGLRAKHFDTILNEQPPVPWFEVVADQFLHSNGVIIDKLQHISQHYPVVLHCLGCSVGSTDPLNMTYLSAIKSLAQRINAAWISDHCCWVSTQGQYLFDLMPLPFNDLTISHVAMRAHMIQDFLERPFALENVSAYFAYCSSTMTEAQFLNQIAAQADINLLLDVNNVYVSAHNQKSDPQDYLAEIDATRVIQMHLAGYEQRDNLLIDTHGDAVHPPVWQLYQQALTSFGPIPTSIEWDSHIPDWPTYWAEHQQAQHYLQAAPTTPNTPQQYHPLVSASDITPLAQLQHDICAAVWPRALTNHSQAATGQTQTSTGHPQASTCHSQASTCHSRAGGNPIPEQTAHHHLAHAPAQAQQRLQIYQGSIIGNIIGAYRRIFPATRQLVGDEYLNHLIEDALQQTHCTDPDITAGAAELIDFVRTHPPTQQTIPYLADFMQFEWYWYQTFHHGETATALTLQSTYPLAEIWAMCQPEYQGEAAWPDTNASLFCYEFIYQHGKVLTLLKESQP